MSVKYVPTLHDEGGKWYVALLLGQHRSGGRWRAVVRYTVSPGMRYQRGLWANDVRPVRA